jgi:hypothetical protein
VRWNITTKKAPKLGEWRNRTIFAWWPVTIGTQRVWLEKVISVEIYTKDSWSGLNWYTDHYLKIDR